MPLSLQSQTRCFRSWAEVTIGVPSPARERELGLTSPFSVDFIRNSFLKMEKSVVNGCTVEGNSLSNCFNSSSSLILTIGSAFCPFLEGFFTEGFSSWMCTEKLSSSESQSLAKKSAKVPTPGVSRTQNR